MSDEKEPELPKLAEVIDFSLAVQNLKREETFSPPERVRSDYKDCQHKKRLIDPKLRKVTCRHCKEALDPIEVLLEIASEYGEWHVTALKKQVAALEYLKKLIEWDGKQQLLSEEEKKMNGAELMHHHSLNGHPPEKIELTRSYMKCYCGVTYSRLYYRELETKVIEAQNRQRQKLKMDLVKPAKE